MSRAPTDASDVSDALEDAIHDEYGGYSRRFVVEVLGIEIARAVRNSRALAVLVIDVVHLERINVAHGRSVGDELLRELGRLVHDSVRNGDIVGRWRDDMFALVLAETPLDGATVIANRILDLLRLASFRPEPIAIQIGLAALQPGSTAEGLLDHAAASARTPNTVQIAPALIAELAGRVPLSPGAVIGNYRVLHLIGEGGGGRVYRAEDITLARPVALKILRPELAADPRLLARFRNEATLLAAIQHPNLVQVYTFGDTPDGTFFAMELVEGETLADSIQRSRRNGTYVAIPQLVTCLRQIASALDRLHQVGMLHRDVKPENIAFDPFRERAVLLDVGVAKQVDRGGEAAGTAGFVAPEVILGEPEAPGSDVFGLAVTAYLALTFRYPWASFDSQLQLVAERGEPVRPPSALRPELAPADQVFRLGLAYDRAERLHSPVEFVELLAAALAAITAPHEPRITGRIPTILSTISGSPISRQEPTKPPSFDALQPSQTRGIVFKTVTRVLDPRDLQRLIEDHPNLAEVLGPQSSGLEWIDSGAFFDLLDAAAATLAAPAEFARRFGRAVIRSSFQRFFPAVATTLSPERVASSLPTVWTKYHSWGKLRSTLLTGALTVTFDAIPRASTILAPWLEGMVAQTITLSGGTDVVATVTSTAPLAIHVTWVAQPR